RLPRPVGGVRLRHQALRRGVGRRELRPQRARRPPGRLQLLRAPLVPDRLAGRPGDHLDVRRGPHRLRARGAVRRQARREPHLQGLRAAAVRRRFLTCNLLTRKADSMTEQISSLKALILSSNDRKFEDVEIPEWGGVKVRVKALTDAQLGEYQGKTMALKSS